VCGKHLLWCRDVGSASLAADGGRGRDMIAPDVSDGPPAQARGMRVADPRGV